MPFSELSLIEPLRRALAKEGYEEPTPIQEKAIPIVLSGRDLLGSAQTGTGKTAAFGLPLLQRLAAEKKEGRIRSLILSPTRELAAQIGERLGAYGRHLGLRHTVVFGGVSQFHQVRALRPPPAVVVATPGRLLDLSRQRLIDLSHVEILVLDEADRMLDMGFIHDVRRVVAMTPSSRQTLFFSATMPPDIVSLAKSILKDPVSVAVAPMVKTAEKVEQSLYFVSRPDKRGLLERLLADESVERALVFTRTKRGADRVADYLDRAGISADSIHGDKTQGARERALSDFRKGSTRVLVATDLAARGIDVEGISHVLNYDMPNVPESYVHRIGRTGRAGASGIAVSFCDEEELVMLKGIERLIGKRIPVAEGTPDRRPADAPAPVRGAAPRPAPQKRSAPRPPSNERRSNDGARHRDDARRSNDGRADARRPAPRATPHGIATRRPDDARRSDEGQRQFGGNRHPNGAQHSDGPRRPNGAPHADGPRRPSGGAQRTDGPRRPSGAPHAGSRSWVNEPVRHFDSSRRANDTNRNPNAPRRPNDGAPHGAAPKFRALPGDGGRPHSNGPAHRGPRSDEGASQRRRFRAAR